MVRLVFRPYTQIRRSICTSESLRASTRVSSGFTLFRHSSPSFGSQHVCSYSNLSENFKIGRWCTGKGSHLRSLSLRTWVYHSSTRIDVRLLGPCFKTGRLKSFRQHPRYVCQSSLKLYRGPQSQPLQAKGAITLQAATFSKGFYSDRNWCWLATKRVHRPVRTADLLATWLISIVSLLAISRTV